MTFLPFENSPMTYENFSMLRDRLFVMATPLPTAISCESRGLCRCGFWYVLFYLVTWVPNVINPEKQAPYAKSVNSGDILPYMYTLVRM